MSSWFYTHIKKTDAVSDAAIEHFIRSEQKGARSLAHLNGEYSFKDVRSSEWALITPNGFYDTTEEGAESCRRLSEYFKTTLIMTLGQGNCSGMVFTVYENGFLRRHVSAGDGYLGANFGHPYSWEAEIFGDLEGEEVGLFECTLEKVAAQFHLTGYEASPKWDVDRKVAFS